MFANAQYHLLKKVFPQSAQPAPASAPPAPFAGARKLQSLLDPAMMESVRGKHVIDFGCGEGHEAIALARLGATQVTGIDVREDVLQVARRNAAAAGVVDICHFAQTPQQKADLVISIDAFEHFHDPARILEIFDELLIPGGSVLVSFGPTWYHPMGGHLFSVFPWAHLLFSEEALIRWRADFKSDGAKRFGEVAGGLNQMTISRFEQLVAQSQFRFKSYEAVPIRKLRFFHNRFTREYTSAIVRCRLKRMSEQTTQLSGV